MQGASPRLRRVREQKNRFAVFLQNRRMAAAQDADGRSAKAFNVRLQCLIDKICGLREPSFLYKLLYRRVEDSCVFNFLIFSILFVKYTVLAEKTLFLAIFGEVTELCLKILTEILRNRKKRQFMDRDQYF